jgi:hypothetical protein
MVFEGCPETNDGTARTNTNIAAILQSLIFIFSSPAAV